MSAVGHVVAFDVLLSKKWLFSQPKFVRIEKQFFVRDFGFSKL